MNLFSWENFAFKKMNSGFKLGFISLSLLISSGVHAQNTATAKPEVLPLDSSLQITFDPKQWLYYQPKFMEESKVSMFEGQKLDNLRAFLHSDKYVTVEPNLTELCKTLTALPLDPTQKNTSKSEPVKISGAKACRVTKSDEDRIAVQYIFVSKRDLKHTRRPSNVERTRFYSHYLYFYYPKTSSKEAEPLIASLVDGIGSKK